MKKLYIFFVLILLAQLSSSQISFVNYENSGHYNDAFSTIAFDNDNNPWVGTLLNGVHFYKGTVFQNFNISNSPILHDKIYDLLYDSLENQLYIATLEGLSTLKEEIWTAYTSDNSNLPSNAVLSLAMDKNSRLWIGTDKGVLDGLNGTVYNKENTIMKGNIILHIFIDSEGSKWFATDEEIVKFDNENWQVFSSENTILPKVSALCVAEDTTGLIWASFGDTYSGTLATYDGELWRIFDKNILDNLSSRIRSVVPLNDGSVWFGTHDKGLIRYKDSEWSASTTDNSDIPINQIIRMEADRDDNLWLAHRNGLTKVIADNTVGLTQSSVHKLLIVPNPVDEHARILINRAPQELYQLVVTDLNGRIVRRAYNISDGYLMNKKDLNPGIYLLQISNSTEFFIGKIVVK